MMINSITPPPELVTKWITEARSQDYCSITEQVATRAARWGSDQELEAYCKWLPKLPPWSADDLRRHRRPKPPRLKEQALGLLNEGPVSDLLDHEVATIRRALEQLDD